MEQAIEELIRGAIGSLLMSMTVIGAYFFIGALSAVWRQRK